MGSRTTTSTTTSLDGPIVYSSTYYTCRLPMRCAERSCSGRSVEASVVQSSMPVDACAHTVTRTNHVNLLYQVVDTTLSLLVVSVVLVVNVVNLTSR